MPALTMLVFIVFAILVPILLLSMLVAMFVHTYEKIIRRSEKEWKRQWAKIIIVLEQTYSIKKLQKLQAIYSVPFLGSTNQDEARGLMVIKPTAKTRAHEMKVAFANWKRLTSLVNKTLKTSQEISATNQQSIASTFSFAPSQKAIDTKNAVNVSMNQRAVGLLNQTVNLQDSSEVKVHEETSLPGSNLIFAGEEQRITRLSSYPTTDARTKQSHGFHPIDVGPGIKHDSDAKKVNERKVPITSSTSSDSMFKGSSREELTPSDLDRVGLVKTKRKRLRLRGRRTGVVDVMRLESSNTGRDSKLSKDSGADSLNIVPMDPHDGVSNELSGRSQAGLSDTTEL